MTSDFSIDAIPGAISFRRVSTRASRVDRAELHERSQDGKWAVPELDTHSRCHTESRRGISPRPACGWDGKMTFDFATLDLDGSPDALIATAAQGEGLFSSPGGQALP